MKYYKLTKQEEKLLKDFNKGVFKSIGNLSAKKKEYQQYAKNTLGKKTNINIRLSEKTLHKLKSKAAERGLPYQTLASSILHRFVVN